LLVWFCWAGLLGLLWLAVPLCRCAFFALCCGVKNVVQK
jgi:hypothetical protein